MDAKNKVNIHTVEFSYVGLSDIEHNRLLKELNPEKQNRTNSKLKIFKGYSQFRGIRYEYLLINELGFQKRLLKVIINPMTILNKQELFVEDYDTFQGKYNFLISQEFSFQTLSSEIFTRIDYFIDVEFVSKDKVIILGILKKAPSVYRGLKQTEYKSSVYYNSQSRHINIYSRFEKIIKMLLEYTYINPGIVDPKTEIEPFINQNVKSTIRYEVQVKRKKIMYNFKEYGVCPELPNYWNSRDAVYFLNESLKPIICDGDYYNSYHAHKKLNEFYKNKKLVDDLLKYQNYLSNHGYDKAKRLYKNHSKYSDYFKKAEVNPYLIPYNKGITFIKNPFKFLKKSDDAYKIPSEDWTGILSK